MNKLRFTKVRDVKSPSRGNVGDAGIDFYTPVNLTLDDLVSANKNAENIVVSTEAAAIGMVKAILNDEGFIKCLRIGPHSRVIIPSGIRVLLEPLDSALIAANKSGVATKQGLVYTAEVVDSTYTGELHICVANTSACSTDIELGKKLTQFMHMPVYLTEPEEIAQEEYNQEAEDWSTRGNNWQGSTDEQEESNKEPNNNPL